MKEGSPNGHEDMKGECYCCPWSFSSLFPPTKYYYWSLSFFLSFITEVIKPCQGAPPRLITATVNKEVGWGGSKENEEEDGGEERHMKKTLLAKRCVIIIL